LINRQQHWRVKVIIPLEMTEQEFQEWRSLQGTQVFYQLLRAWREALKEQWAKGHWVGDLEGNSAAIAQVDMIEKLLDLDYTQVKESLDESDE
jgi:hypothetical protein